jgi:rRNA maturation endonuclease Nob1
MKKEKKHYYYFCPACKKAIPRDFKQLKWKSFCEKTGKDVVGKLITKVKI